MKGTCIKMVAYVAIHQTLKTTQQLKQVLYAWRKHGKMYERERMTYKFHDLLSLGLERTLTCVVACSHKC
jgi:hypothetical protein